MKSLIVLLLVCFSLNFSCKETNNKETELEADIQSNSEDSKDNSNNKIILFFGNSLTAGYGLDESEAFPALIQNRIDSIGLNYTVVNAGNSGETTSGGLNRIDWILNQKVDVFVLELGANDGLRGVPLSETKSNLQSIIDIVKAKNPETKIVLTGMQLPPNMGPEYTSEFKGIFPELAEANNLELVPFLLEGVGGIPSLNQGDGIHPTAEGHKILAETIWEVLDDLVLVNNESNQNE